MKGFRWLLLGLLLATTPAVAWWQSIEQRSVGAACTFSTLVTAGSSLPGGLTLARSTTATYTTNAAGSLISTAAINTARFATASNGSTYLYVEPAATNLVLQSNSFTTTPWFTTNATVSNPATIASPDGTSDGWLFTSTSFGNVGQSLTVSAAPYIMSGWNKLNTAAVQYYYQLTGSTISGVQTSTSTWVRFAFNPTAVAGSQSAFNNINAATGTLSMFGFQIELSQAAGYFATHPTSYIATTTVAVTRAADVATFTQPAGCGHNTYTFDDASTQTVAQAPGSATIPVATLNRPWIASIAGSA